MRQIGPLEGMARADLDVLLEEVGRRYRAGAEDALAARDPAWRARVDALERQVGSLYQTLVEADHVVADWRRAVSELRALRLRAGDEASAVGAGPAEPAAPELLAAVA
jgi:hypothetical protein